MKAVLLTGGNLGDIDKSMVQARELIAQRAGEIVAESKIYTSEAWGFESDNLFKNQVIIIDTPLSPLELLDSTQQIESELGRVRPVNKNGYTSRTMDIDILYIDQMVIRSPPTDSISRICIEPTHRGCAPMGKPLNREELRTNAHRTH